MGKVLFIPRHTESLDNGPQQDGLLTGVLQQLLKCQGSFSSLCLFGEEKHGGWEHMSHHFWIMMSTFTL